MFAIVLIINIIIITIIIIVIVSHTCTVSRWLKMPPRTCPECGEHAPVPRLDVWYWEGPVEGGRWIVVWYHRACWLRKFAAASGGG